jgi:hypothetical protein
LPAHDAADSVDVDFDSVRDAQGRFGGAEDHGDLALAGERGEVRGAAAELGHHPGDRRQHVAEPGPRDASDEDIARRDAAKLAFATDHAGPPGGATDARGLAADRAAGGRGLGFRSGRAQICRIKHERSRLDELEASIAEDPLDLDGMSEDRLRAAEQAKKLHCLRTIEARRKSGSCPSWRV